MYVHRVVLPGRSGWSRACSRLHVRALPYYAEPAHGSVADAKTYEEYPITCITGRRIPVYFHSEHRQLPWCRELWPVPRMEINPETAAELGIEQGDWVWIESPWGKVRQTADLYYASSRT